MPKKAPSKAKSTDAIALLKQDHAQVKDLLEQICDSGERATKQRRSLMSEIAALIKAHTKIEEEIFYPAFQGAAESKDDSQLYYEAMEEHHAADTVLADCLKADPHSPKFTAKVKVLQELVLHHVKEEEKEMFPRARKLIERAELVQLGQRLQTRKNQLLGNGHRVHTARSARA